MLLSGDVPSHSQLVEHILGKDDVIIFSAERTENRSTLINSSKNNDFAVIAQLVEHILGKDEVISSTLINSSTKTI